jgi:outer membrane lipoprotein-sorting protein
MNRRTLLAALPVLASAWAIPRARAAALTDRDRQDLTRIETYLDGVKSLKARFVQVAPDGSTARGTAWLSRPGRMRFQYDPPSPLLLVAGHGLVVFHDSQLEQTSNIPLGQTPLGILLRDNVSLSGDVTVTSVVRQPGMLQITLLRTASPGDGSLTLNFADPPLALRQWTVTDAQRRQTTVSLYDIALGGTFDDKLFEYVDPHLYGGGGGNN